MAEIHQTTMTPTKLELITGWLPRQPWYRGERPPSLTRVGGFRLDDPAGEVGIEFMFVADVADSAAATVYHVPMTYRGAPLVGARPALLGTAVHGVLGRRWIYDGADDPVAVAQLLALFTGAVAAQHQRLSDTPDPTVTGRWHAEGRPIGPGRLAAHLIRVLAPDVAPPRDPSPAVTLGHVEADVPQPDGPVLRRAIAVVAPATGPTATARLFG